MGLSDQERLRGMYFAIRDITGIAKHLRQDYEEVHNLINQLWHAFLGNDTQNLLWIMGSNSEQTIKGEPHSPFTLAVTCKLEEKANKERQIDVKFNILDHLCMSTLLKHSNWNGASASYLLKAYQHTETIMYYLRRYNDDFSDRYEKASSLVSRIQGECFRAFSKRDCFAKAYLIHEMMEILYGKNYPYDSDVVTSILESEVLHHDFTGLMNLQIEDLIPHHIELVQAFEADNDYKLNRLRLFKVIEFSTKTHQYEHVRKNIIAKLEVTDLAKEIPEVNKAWDRLKKLWEKNKEAENKRYDEQSGSSLDCYGFEAYSIEREAENETEKLAKKSVKKKTRK